VCTYSVRKSSSSLDNPLISAPCMRVRSITERKMTAAHAMRPRDTVSRYFQNLAIKIALKNLLDSLYISGILFTDL
jgi:hypothetical protein